MSESFDPYRKWLGIPSAEQPPHHYRLLGVGLFEDDPDVIESTADQRMSHLRSFQTGVHSAHSQRLLNEVSAAKLCLLDPRKKSSYDAELRVHLTAMQAPTQHVSHARTVVTPPVGIAPVMVEPSPLVITDTSTKTASRNLTAMRRRKPSLWPAAGITALLAAIFVGYLIWAKPEPEETAIKAAVPEAPPSPSATPKTPPLKSQPQQQPSPVPPPSVVAAPVTHPAEEEQAAPSTVATTRDQPMNDTPPEAALTDSSSNVSPAEPKAPTDSGNKTRSFSDLADDKKVGTSTGLPDKLTAEEAYVLKQHTSAVTRVAFHPTLPLLASSGKDGRVILWNLENKAAQGEVAKFNEEVWALKFSPNGELLTFANRNWWGSIVSFRSMDGGREVKKIKDFKNGGGAVASIAYSPDGRFFAAGQDDGTVRLWETASFQEFPPLSLGAEVFFVAFGPITFDRKHKPAEYLVAAGCKDGTIRTLRVAVAKDKTGIRRIFEPTSVDFPKRQGVLCVRFSPDGKLLGAVRFAGLISLYDPETGIALREMRAGNGNSDWISFHPQRPWIATAHWNDRVARIWHQSTGAILCELRGHTAGVFCAEFSRDGRGIATASGDFSIKIWDLVGADVPEAPKRAKKGKPPTMLVGD